MDELLANASGSGEADLTADRIAKELRRDRGSVADDELKYPKRDAGCLYTFGKQYSRERRLAGWLEDYGTASGQRRRHLTYREHQREVPRSDGAHNADGGPHHHVAFTGNVVWYQPTIGVLRFFCEPTQMILAHQDLALALGQRLAILAGNDSREVRFAANQLIGDPMQQRAAILDRAVTP